MDIKGMETSVMNTWEISLLFFNRLYKVNVTQKCPGMTSEHF